MTTPAPYEDEAQPQTLTWNLLFDAAGEVRPELAYWLADEHQLVLTRDPELFGTGAVDENDNPLEVVLLKPGATITGRVVDAIDDCLASYLECSEEGIDFSWSGYPPLPNAFVIESTPRPDPHLPLRYFGHPIFWLPPDVLRPLPDEPLSIYTVRICMELVARGVMNAETGDVVDVLVANGLDYRDPELDEMLEAWRSGEDVPELDELILPDPPDLADNPRGKSWSLVAATSLVRELWPSYNLAECEDLNGSVAQMLEQAESVGVKEATAAFEAAGKKWVSSRRTPDDGDALRDAAIEFSDELFRYLDEIWLDLVLIDKLRANRAFQYNGRVSDLETSTRAELSSLIETNIKAFDAEMFKLVDAVIDAPPGQEPSRLTEVWNHFATAWTRWVSGDTSACREAVKLWVEKGPVDVSEFVLGDPPSVPEHSSPALPSSVG